MTSCEILVARAKFLVALATRKSQFPILIRNLSIQGEKLSAAVETVEPFLQKLCKVNEEKGLIPEQIYNGNETGLLWKCLPDRTLVACRETTALGFKKSKDHLTVLGCTNATGTKFAK